MGIFFFVRGVGERRASCMASNLCGV